MSIHDIFSFIIDTEKDRSNEMNATYMNSIPHMQLSLRIFFNYALNAIILDIDSYGTILRSICGI